MKEKMTTWTWTGTPIHALRHARLICAFAAYGTIQLWKALPWKTCYLFWFGEEDLREASLYQTRCRGFVQLWASPVFVLGRVFLKVFQYHPTVCYSEDTLVRKLQDVRPGTTGDKVVIMMRMLAPRLDFQALALNPDRHWDYGQNKTPGGRIWKPLCCIGALPPSFQSQVAFCVALFTSPGLAGRAENIKRQYYSKTLPDSITFCHRLLRSVARNHGMRMIPVLLPDVKAMQEAKPWAWLDSGKLNSLPGFAGPICQQEDPFDDPDSHLRFPSHLKTVLQLGSRERIAVVFHHASFDPCSSIEDWGLLLGNLGPNCLFGYAVSAYHDIDEPRGEWGQDGLDYMVTVKVHTLRLVRMYQAKDKNHASLEEMYLAKTLIPFLRCFAASAEEAGKLETLCSLKELERPKGGNAKWPEQVHGQIPQRPGPDKEIWSYQYLSLLGKGRPPNLESLAMGSSPGAAVFRSDVAEKSENLRRKMGLTEEKQGDGAGSGGKDTGDKAPKPDKPVVRTSAAENQPAIDAEEFAESVKNPVQGERAALEDAALTRLVRGYEGSLQGSTAWTKALGEIFKEHSPPSIEEEIEAQDRCSKLRHAQRLTAHQRMLIEECQALVRGFRGSAGEVFTCYILERVASFAIDWLAITGENSLREKTAFYIAAYQDLEEHRAFFAALTPTECGDQMDNAHRDSYLQWRNELEPQITARNRFVQLYKAFGPVVFMDPFWNVSNLTNNARTKEFPILFGLILTNIPQDSEDATMNVAEYRYKGSKKALEGTLRAVDCKLWKYVQGFLADNPDEVYEDEE
ncbi:hypothetical protein DFH06DRAFT_1118556 [Mycena polygramma]|nr:hypothetical protein DFH06DRAFT_1118556 [Mycena polygramma]